MNDILLIIIAILLFVLVAVFAYNMFQEKHYRNKIRNQFGHADRDALLGSQTQSVRDGQNLSHEHVSAHVKAAKLKPSLVGKKPEPDTVAMAIPLHEEVLPEEETIHPNAVEPTTTAPVEETEPRAEMGLVSEIKATFSRMLGGSAPIVVDAEPEAQPVAQDIPAAERPSRLLISINDLRASTLPWFDERADYLAYVGLREPVELPALPCLSNRYRYQIIGCTMDGLFQPAEPVPGVMYQAFVMGLQAISRNGLADERELAVFGRNVREFAQDIEGEVSLDDVPAFLAQARPLDELCAQVDQTIAIHLVSRVSILGIELGSTLEELGFVLMDDGTFAFADINGDVKYTVVTLDGSRFTASLLASQPYKGFSMLFDITHVPQGENNFDEFMNLAVRLSSMLNLELVDDQIRQLSTEWMKEVRTHVLGVQKETLQANIAPGGALAQRLFA